MAQIKSEFSGIYPMSNPSVIDLPSSHHPQEKLIQLITPCVHPLGYEVIYIELQTHRQKTLRIFIDHLQPGAGIGIEDCVKVSRALDEFLEQSSEIQALLPGAYELEVSSPGVDRPLRSASDYERFAGREVRIHTYRPLSAEELENKDYQAKNPKQKNFLGTLVGLREGKVVLSFSSKTQGTQKSGKKSGASKKAALETNSVEGVQILIPLPLISKANLEPNFDFEASDERELEI